MVNFKIREAYRGEAISQQMGRKGPTMLSMNPVTSGPYRRLCRKCTSWHLFPSLSCLSKQTISYLDAFLKKILQDVACMRINNIFLHLPSVPLSAAGRQSFTDSIENIQQPLMLTMFNIDHRLTKHLCPWTVGGRCVRERSHVNSWRPCKLHTKV